MFCMKCGTSLPDDANFCFKCGCNLKNHSQRARVDVGDYVKFGRYPQNYDDNKEPIEWLVLDVKRRKTLLLSRYGLDCKQYDPQGSRVEWEWCSLRWWLNKDFIIAAFSEEEQQQIILSNVVNNDNPKYGTDGGDDTRDYVFCLSIEETEKYFGTEDERLCLPTEFSRSRAHALNQKSTGCWNGRYATWWLRSPGGPHSSASFVNRNGQLALNGGLYNWDCIAVRPALWVKL